MRPTNSIEKSLFGEIDEIKNDKNKLEEFKLRLKRSAEDFEIKLSADNRAIEYINFIKDIGVNSVCLNCGAPRPKHYEGEGSCESCAQ